MSHRLSVTAPGADVGRMEGGQQGEQAYEVDDANVVERCAFLRLSARSGPRSPLLRRHRRPSTHLRAPTVRHTPRGRSSRAGRSPFSPFGVVVSLPRFITRRPGWCYLRPGRALPPGPGTEGSRERSPFCRVRPPAARPSSPSWISTIISMPPRCTHRGADSLGKSREFQSPWPRHDN